MTGLNFVRFIRSQILVIFTDWLIVIWESFDSTLYNDIQDILKGDILKGDIRTWDFALKVVLDTWISH